MKIFYNNIKNLLTVVGVFKNYKDSKVCIKKNNVYFFSEINQFYSRVQLDGELDCELDIFLDIGDAIDFFRFVHSYKNVTHEFNEPSIRLTHNKNYILIPYFEYPFSFPHKNKEQKTYKITDTELIEDFFNLFPRFLNPSNSISFTNNQIICYKNYIVAKNPIAIDIIRKSKIEFDDLIIINPEISKIYKIFGDGFTFCPSYMDDGTTVRGLFIENSNITFYAPVLYSPMHKSIDGFIRYVETEDFGEKISISIKELNTNTTISNKENTKNKMILEWKESELLITNEEKRFRKTIKTSDHSLNEEFTFKLNYNKLRMVVKAIGYAKKHEIVDVFYKNGMLLFVVGRLMVFVHED